MRCARRQFLRDVASGLWVAAAPAIVRAAAFEQDLPFKSLPTAGGLPVGGIAQDTMESYSDGVDVNALAGGSNWNGAFVDRSNALGIQSFDTMETYADGVNLNGLSGGNGWPAAWVDRTATA